VYVGDRNYARDNIRITVEGEAPIPVPNTAANVFAVVMSGAVPVLDGRLDITISDLGGDSYWVINGIDVWQDGQDPGAAPLMASPTAEIERPAAAGELTDAQLASVVAVARQQWLAQDLTPTERLSLESVTVRVADLTNPSYLGLTTPAEVLIDNDAAGYGWNTGYGSRDAGSQLSALGSPLSFDLLSVVMHELGHVLGLPDLDGDEHQGALMGGRLRPGVQRVSVGVAERLDSGAWLAPLRAGIGESGYRAAADQLFGAAEESGLLSGEARGADGLLNARRVKAGEASRIERTMQTRREEIDDREDFFAELAADGANWL
jgi:hypothetical protein